MSISVENCDQISSLGPTGTCEKTRLTLELEFVVSLLLFKVITSGYISCDEHFFLEYMGSFLNVFPYNFNFICAFCNISPQVVFY